ncbi:cupin domain-containing protein [Streptococcus loxodontisalivarius]|uniref:Quercetin dioxygenase-like cupin family protein n=1 Tax=Streptococcus loxodontisalivarius TaxID=1349415 RepID=A0ABS2PS47_9STRE|nr:cupin domain-containing protein [Streptococcus loxodontisalivarius]MBM7642696.1 quercetin dioxygenase-like cupin family protein [Streptococcus loxodontisalivarius]
MTEKLDSLFGRGDKNDAYVSVFTGQSYLNMLVQAPDGHFSLGNVTFEPGCRNNWHAHTDGYQILLVTDGQGLYQEEGKPARLIKAGDVVVTEQNVKHWHGATANSWMAHIAITAGPSEFFEAVSDEAFAQANQEAKAN